MDWHRRMSKDVVKKLGSSFDGLSEGEVQKRFGEFGKNVLRERALTKQQSQQQQQRSNL